MARWLEIEDECPEAAEAARHFFNERKHKTLATIREDGSPRLSGSESFFADGDVWFGSMLDASKARDLDRDARFALHSGSVDPPNWAGDTKIAGTVEEVTDFEIIKKVFDELPPEPFHAFRANITELVVVALAPEKTHLLVDVWREGRGLTRYVR